MALLFFGVATALVALGLVMLAGPDPAPAPGVVELLESTSGGSEAKEQPVVAEAPLLKFDDEAQGKVATDEATGARRADKIRAAAPKAAPERIVEARVAASPARPPARVPLDDREVARPPADKDLRPRSAVSGAVLPSVPAVKERSPPKVEMGCIRLLEGGMNSWVDESSLGRTGSNHIVRVAAGTHRVRQGLELSDADGIESVIVKPREMTSVRCNFGKWCKVESSGRACP
jgi:hypothetical protein